MKSLLLAALCLLAMPVVSQAKPCQTSNWIAPFTRAPGAPTPNSASTCVMMDQTNLTCALGQSAADSEAVLQGVAQAWNTGYGTHYQVQDIQTQPVEKFGYGFESCATLEPAQ